MLIVTGGAGFIGSHLADRLGNVKILDNLSSGRIENVKSHKLLILDLKDFERTLEAIEDAETIFHFAANPEVRVSTISPKIHFDENILATFNLLEAMRKKDVKEIVFASSSSVYGEPEFIPIDEKAPVKPISIYGASKAACENLIHAYSNLYGIRAIILRYANVVGPRLRHGVIYDFILKLIKNPEVLEILGDGNQIRSYIHVSDAVEATIKAWSINLRNFEVYNVGNEDWISVNEVARITLETLGLKNTKFIYKPILNGVGWLGDVKRIALSIEKLKSLGWRPKMNSREALIESVKSILSEL
ncbi:MAG: NAD-dependent epimerase/dehydratase family protein [Candidatus Methanomethyliaceae archaeon]|nr:NAD-dependent epimerase/dehydratase family protein [Candidatus Methanomethyliaceae archaeon]MDW7971316.1 NAD-dependent epimerase/dehydratase family protein [Nitrososphaerota archaeon]